MASGSSARKASVRRTESSFAPGSVALAGSAASARARKMSRSVWVSQVGVVGMISSAFPLPATPGRGRG